jgi:hypothetical protein
MYSYIIREWLVMSRSKYIFSGRKIRSDMISHCIDTDSQSIGPRMLSAMSVYRECKALDRIHIVDKEYRSDNNICPDGA